MANLGTMRQLMRALGHPERRFPAVHIVGTNGKGSVATKIAKGLELSGRKTGLFTSPHISSFRERIQINGQPISVEALELQLERIFSITEPAFFETAVAAAFNYFAESGVEIAVVEAGLGGRLDATNVLEPCLSVITSIGLDHTETLGETLEEIAQEKAAIARPGVPLLLGPRTYPLEGDRVEGQPADFIEENRLIAKRALEMLSVKACEEALALQPPCRFERRGEVLFDVAHNPDGIEQLVKALQRHYPDERPHFFVGFSKGKAIDEMLKHLEDYPVQLVTAEHPWLIKGLPGQRPLEEVFPASGFSVVCGSFYLMAEARRIQKRRSSSGV